MKGKQYIYHKKLKSFRYTAWNIVPFKASLSVIMCGGAKVYTGPLDAFIHFPAEIPPDYYF